MNNIVILDAVASRLTSLFVAHTASKVLLRSRSAWRDNAPGIPTGMLAPHAFSGGRLDAQN